MTKRLPKLPTTVPLDDTVFETILSWFDKFVAGIKASDSHRILPGFIKRLVYEGKMSLRRVIDLTRDKDAAIDADQALRAIAAEMIERHEQLPILLTAYLISPLPRRGRGRCSSDAWLRDQCIAICTALAIERWGAVIDLTRDPEVTAAPSLCSLVSRVCHARDIPIGEKRVKQIYDRFAEFMPVHHGWLAIKSNSAI